MSRTLRGSTRNFTVSAIELFLLHMKYATAIVTVLIIIAVLIPGSDLPEVGIGGFDKFVHITMFMTWAWAVRWDFPSEKFRFALVFFVGLLFSLLTEVLQLLVEGRTFDLYDMVADGLGLAVGLISGGSVVRLANRIFRSSSRSR
jgi:VanZ family protein